MDYQGKFRTLNEYCNEISSEAFMNGMTLCVKQTQETGRETAFRILSHPEKEGIYYSPVFIGEETSVLADNLVLNSDSEKDYGKPLHQLQSIRKVVELAKKRILYFEKKDRLDFGWDMTRKENGYKDEINVHTHPFRKDSEMDSDFLGPLFSKVDLKNLDEKDNHLEVVCAIRTLSFQDEDLFPFLALKKRNLEEPVDLSRHDRLTLGMWGIYEKICVDSYHTSPEYLQFLKSLRDENREKDILRVLEELPKAMEDLTKTYQWICGTFVVRNGLLVCKKLKHSDKEGLDNKV